MSIEDPNEINRRLQAVRTEAITAFAQVNANLNNAVAFITGQPVPPDTTDPATCVLEWGGEHLQQLNELVEVIARETTDTDPREAILRGLAIYRSFVSHARGGGKVLYVAADGSTRTLKVRLR